MGIAKHGLQTLLSTNYYFTDVLSDGLLDKEPEQKLVWLCGGILSNIALHPNNRCPALLLVVPLCSFTSCPPLLFVLCSSGVSFVQPCCAPPALPLTSLCPYQICQICPPQLLVDSTVVSLKRASHPAPHPAQHIAVSSVIIACTLHPLIA